MFSQNQKEEFRKTHAPVELKDRILETIRENGRVQKQKSFGHTYFVRVLIAAILAAVAAFSVFSLSRPRGGALFYGGENVSYDSVFIGAPENAVSAYSMRRLGGGGIKFEIRSDDEFVIATCDGEFCVFDNETGEILFCGGSFEGNGSTYISWNVDLSQKTSYSLTITRRGKTEHYVLDADPETSSYTISRKAV